MRIAPATVGTTGDVAYRKWILRAACSSSSRKSGWAMAIRARARSAMLRPWSSATPHSVTMVRACARVVTTPAPSRRNGCDPRDGSVRRGRGERDDGAALRCQRGAPHEVHLAADARVEARTDRVGDDLPGEVHLDRRVDGRHPAQLADDRGVVGVVDAAHLDHGVAVHEVVEARRPHHERGDHLVAVDLLRRAGQRARTPRGAGPRR